ncbi:fatty acid CoA ligase family protein [Vulgatibacter incomptus]|uniref:AMP-dependent synthetase/ligase in alkane synthesis cluster n=1 Tax=Vulgatibacter incomptus TaxID=1391653 RepID=A0A0K1PFY8_9BACT|nr:fatty acid CoA ligase family protein [Vulgatibacter incomptus]AKU92029.1 AMP-dependent synthetase/ligase in alkane synthesis cluster [Vulgatibacter incomptus]
MSAAGPSLQPAGPGLATAEGGPVTTCNIASHLPAMAALQSDRPAVIVPAKGGGWERLSFRELDARSDLLAHGLESAGIASGTRTVLMVKPSLDFFALVFALFKVGAVPVLIDPGIGKRALLRCLTEVEAEAFVGIPAAHLARLLVPAPFRTVKTLVTVGRKLGWGGNDLESLARLGAGKGPYRMAETSPEALAAILFTSGSTGIPKGAIYTHGIFDAQVRSIRALYGIEPGEIDLATFPLFALFDPALGMTAVVPEMDARFPAKADPRKLVHAIEAHGATNMFGSPALLDNLSRHAEAAGIRFPTLRRVLSAGAPVRRDIVERMQGRLDGEAQVFTPFGATESLPVASIGSREVLEETSSRTATGGGICVGRPAPGITARIIRIDDGPIDSWSDDLELPRGEIGEITVKGDVVTPGYFARPEQTRLAKIRDGDAIVHRMGDLGWIDELGRLWMCGRKSQRVRLGDGRTLFTECVEQVANRHPAIRRSGLVQAGPGRAALVVEKEPSASANDDTLRSELRSLVDPSIEAILVHRGSLPVDVRHNAKIDRERLGRWAERTLG